MTNMNSQIIRSFSSLLSSEHCGFMPESGRPCGICKSSGDMEV